jgi:hypothetical protein
LIEIWRPPGPSTPRDPMGQCSVGLARIGVSRLNTKSDTSTRIRLRQESLSHTHGCEGATISQHRVAVVLSRFGNELFVGTSAVFTGSAGIFSATCGRMVRSCESSPRATFRRQKRVLQG